MMNRLNGFFNEHPNIKEIADDIKIILLKPIMLLLKIPADIFMRMYNAIPGYINKIIDALGKTIMLPFNVFIGMAAAFSEEPVREKMQQYISAFFKNIASFFKEKSSKKNTACQMKVFFEIVNSQLAIDSSFAKDYAYAWWFGLAAALLQVVSFFTTLSGTSVFFQGIAAIAPFFVAIVIQMGMYFFTKQAFEYNAKKYLIALMCITVLCSLMTSYTGLAVMNHSPEERYHLAYVEYQNVFEKVKMDAENNFMDASAAANELTEKFNAVISNYESLEQMVQDYGEEVDSEPLKGKYDTVQRADGTIESKWNDNADYNNQMDAWKKRSQNKAIAISAESKIRKFIEDNQSQWQEFTADMSLPSLEQAVNAVAEGSSQGNTRMLSDKLESFVADLKDVISLNNKVARITELQKIGKVNDTNIFQQIKKRSAIDAVTLRDYQKIAKNMSKTQGESGLFFEIAEKVNGLFGYNMENGLVNVEEKRTAVQNAVENNYIELAAYLEEDLKDELALAKQKVDELPGSFTYSFTMWLSKDTRGDAVFNLLFAVIPDMLTVMFSFASARKHASFLYVRSSKDYYTETDDLFRMVFRSMQSNELFKISENQYGGMADEQFRLHCLEYVSALNEYISKFLKKFELSECTITEGFDLCWKYINHKEMNEYQPIISVLIKTNLVKVIPYDSYEQMEYDFLLGMEFSSPQNRLIMPNEINMFKNRLDSARKSGYVILLRSKGENYLRENIGDRIVLSQKKGE